MLRFVSRALLAGLFLFASSNAAGAAALPLDWRPGASTIAARCDAAVSQLAERADAIARVRGPHTFANTVLPLENATAEANDELAEDTLLRDLAGDEAVRDAAGACRTAFANAYAKMTSSPALFAALRAAQRSGTARSVYDRKLTELWLTALQRNGAALAPKYRTEYLRLRAELNDAQNRFAQNLAGAGDAIVVGRRELGGIPADMLATCTPERGGAYRIPVNESTLAFLSYAQDENARRAFWFAYNNRAAATNVPLLERTIAIRDRLAHLLGYETWADYRLSDRMAGTYSRAEQFIHNATAALRPATNAELAAMRATVATDRRDPGATLMPWDVARAEYLMRKANAVEDQTVRQYFPLQHTLAAILGVYQTLLGITFERVETPDVWAPDVLEYRVTDTTTHALLGTTYFDLYSREHKYSHADVLALLPARTIDGLRRPPVSVIIADWPKPAPGRPELLSHADVVTFFHELGADMATLLAMAPYETLSDGFRDDFIDAPSQLFESFAWQPQILKRITADWRTGAPMPDETIAKLVASRSTDEAYETTRLLALSSFDIEAHTQGPHVDTTALFTNISAQLLATLDAPGAHPQAAFANLMSGYDAGLYAYPCKSLCAGSLYAF